MIYNLDAMRGDLILDIGNQGENNARTVRFDISAWLAEWPGGAVSIAFKRPEDLVVHPVPLSDYTIADGILTWTISIALTAYGGYGHAVVTYTQGGIIRKSPRINTLVKPGLPPAGPAPDTITDWITDANAKIAEAKSIDSIALTSGDHAPGTTDTYTITYTDATTATFTVYNGQDYQQDFPLTWDEFRNHVRQGTIDNYFSVGDQFTFTKGGVTYTLDLADIGSAARNIAANGNAPTDPNYFTNFPNAKPVTLLMHDVIYGAVFDAPEANYKVLVAIAAGNVNISLTSSAVNSGNAATYDLTVPAGGFAKDSLLRIKDASPTTGPGAKLLYYATPTATAVEVTLTPGAVNTPLTVSPTEAAQLSVQNHKDRVMYGSNNYAQSALRQWLNAAGAKTTFWLPKSIYDLPPSWNGTWDGFLNGMDAEFVAAVGATTRIVANNTVTDGGGVTASYTIADKFFLPSAMEIYNTKENNVAEGVQFDAYVGLADINKIKYQYAAPSTAGLWWLRSPYSADARLARGVASTTGALYSSGVYYGLGAAAACVIL